jgi:hypothetical protein
MERANCAGAYPPRTGNFTWASSGVVDMHTNFHRPSRSLEFFSFVVPHLLRCIDGRIELVARAELLIIRKSSL